MSEKIGNKIVPILLTFKILFWFLNTIERLLYILSITFMEHS